RQVLTALAIDTSLRAEPYPVRKSRVGVERGREKHQHSAEHERGQSDPPVHGPPAARARARSLLTPSVSQISEPHPVLLQSTPRDPKRPANCPLAGLPHTISKARSVERAPPPGASAGSSRPRPLLFLSRVVPRLPSRLFTLLKALPAAALLAT